MTESAPAKRTNPFVLILATIGTFALIGFIAFLTLMLLAIHSVPKIFMSSSSTNSDFLPLSSNEKFIAGIRLDTEINNQSADNVLKKFEEVEKNENAVGVFFEVNSPGGSVVPSQEIYDTIKLINEKKPVVSYVRDVAASGAFYAMAPSKEIIANRNSLVGSIGVIMGGVDATELLKFIKVNPITLKTGKLKDAGSPARSWTEDDKAYLQKLIEDTRRQFAGDVAEARNLDATTMAYMADGRVVLGPEAVNLKLVDKLGTKQDALASLTLLTGLKKTPKLIYIEDRKDVRLLLNELLQESTKFVGTLQSFAQQTTGAKGNVSRLQ